MADPTTTVSLSGDVAAWIGGAVVAAQFAARLLEGVVGKMLPNRRDVDTECVDTVRRLDAKLDTLQRDILEIKGSKHG